MTKFIFITGGVVSSLGKGINGSSIGVLLKSRGFKVFMQKFDPYLNVNPRNMSPLQHGEVFITDDGAEADLDLGHYERFIDENLNKHSSITTGKVYLKVIEKERNNEYNGRTVQVIPHITNAIKEYVFKAAKYSNADFVITEIGGTVGDIESLPFLEAIRQVRLETGFENTFYIHNTLVPYIAVSKELKTKPTQHSVKELRSIGIKPDMIILRSQFPVSSDEKNKISLFCDVPVKNVIEAIDAKSLYEIPLNLSKQKVDEIILDHFRLAHGLLNLREWNNLRDLCKNTTTKLKILFMAPFVALKDAYISILEGFKHAGYHLKADVDFIYLDPNKLTLEEIKSAIDKTKCLIVGPDFEASTKEKICESLRYVLDKNYPFITIGKGTLILYEAAEKTCPDMLDHWRIGGRDVSISENSKLFNIYKKDQVRERFYMNKLVKEIKPPKGFKTSITYMSSPVAYEKEKGFGFGVYFNPGFISRPLKPHPLFVSFLKEILK